MEKKKIESYKDLIVWQKGIELVGELYSVTKGFPKEEMFGLTNQIRRAAVSVPANIAEGWGRNSTKNYIQFIRISIGSLYEIETQLIIANNQNYITNQKKSALSARIDELGKMLNKLLKSLDNFIENK
jgi:four helix bundle protein